MRIKSILVLALVATVLLAVISDINLAWISTEFILTGRIPFTNFHVGFLGSLIVLGIVGSFIGRILYDARIDLYENAIDRSNIQKRALASVNSADDLVEITASSLGEQEDVAGEEDLEVAAI